jgi:hypothetical protein
VAPCRANSAAKRWRAAAVALALLALGAACGHARHAPTRAASTPVVSVATFTPTVVGGPTRAPVTATPPTVAPAPSPPPDSSPAATLPPNVVRPPLAQLRTRIGTQAGAYGSFNWYDPAQDAGYNAQAPYAQLPATAVPWLQGDTAEVSTAAGPFTLGATQVAFYPYDGNVVIPTSPQGQPLGPAAFLAQGDPAQSYQLPGPQLQLSTSVPPGRYVVSVDAQWVDAHGQLPSGFVEQHGALHTQYLFVVDIQADVGAAP